MSPTRFHLLSQPGGVTRQRCATGCWLPQLDRPAGLDPKCDTDRLLHVQGLTKRYGDVVAADEVDLDVSGGTTVGFVGPNGAGKSTTMRSIMGLVKPDSGTITMTVGDQIRPIDAEARQKIGYLPEQRGLYAKMPIGQQVGYFGRLKGLTADSAKRRSAEVLEQLGLSDRMADPLESLSHGNQQRVQLAVALVTDPELLILDEPFNGLDPVAAATLQRVLDERVAAGAGVLLSSHQLDLVERTCDEVVVIANGRVQAHGAVDEVRAHRGQRRLRVRVTGRGAELTAALASVGASRLGTTDVVVAEVPAADVGSVIELANTVGPLSEVHYELPSLSELFADLTERTPQ